MRFIHATLLAGFTICASAIAAPVAFESGPSRVALVELYTSEGCDSCPPADRWLAKQFPAAATDARALALAFHVDYWDRLGWADRFASPAYTERQYASMRANAATFVYTPQVLLQGHDLRGWADADAAVQRAARATARASITLDAAPSGNAVAVTVDAAITDAAARGDVQLLVAYADSGLQSDVGAGENRGKRLSHDHVVRALKSAEGADANGRIHATFRFERPREAGVAPTLVAFVQRRSTGDILQAVGVPLGGCGG